MIKFYYSLAPNPMKVALFLEEAELPYEAIPVDTRKGEQHLPAFTAVTAAPALLRPMRSRRPSPFTSATD